MYNIMIKVYRSRDNNKVKTHCSVIPVELYSVEHSNFSNIYNFKSKVSDEKILGLESNNIYYYKFLSSNHSKTLDVVIDSNESFEEFEKKYVPIFMKKLSRKCFSPKFKAALKKEIEKY